MIDERNFERHVAACRDETEWSLIGEIGRCAPDFANAVRLAHERSPDKVSAEQASSGGMIPIGGGSAEDAESEAPWLGDAVDAAREDAEADVAARSLSGIPPLVPAVRERLTSRTRVLTGVAVAAGLSVLWLGFEAFTAMPRTEAPDRTQAGFQQERAPGDGAGEPRALSLGLAPASSPTRLEATMPPVEAPVVRRPRAQSEPTALAHERTVPDRIAELDAQAQAAWRAGELDRAERLFRSVVDEAPQGRYSELAFGDLFTLARQRGVAEQETALWQRYLELFPRGRFADDARAGLCRRATTDADACWRAYLSDFPRGSHRARAEQAVGAGGEE